MKTVNGQGFAKQCLGFSAIGVLAISSLVLARHQFQPEQSQARGAFLITRKNPARPFPSPTPGKSSVPQPPRQSGEISKTNPGARNSKSRPGGVPNAPDAIGASNPPSNTASNKDGGISSASIGLGYTLYQRTGANAATRVSPTKTFYTGDQVRLVIEPNIDGYLYIFVSTDGAAPIMLFPDPRLNSGTNKVQAHVPYETPSRVSEIKWFTFDAVSGVERLYIVVSRAPLPYVPIAQDLVAYCKKPGQQCAWKPTPQIFNPILASADAPKSVSASKTLGQTQAKIETESIARGFKLEADAPEPTLVEMNVSATKVILVMKTELIHRPR